MSDRYVKRIKQQLNRARIEGLYRNPCVVDKKSGKHIWVGNKKVLNFASNDYLGLGASKKVADLVAEAFKTYGASSSSSRLVTGNSSVICEAEYEYAQYFGYEDALFFPSGYQANLAVLSAFLNQGDIAVFDKHVHASCVAGLKMSGATLNGYNHSSMSHLEKRLGKSKDSYTAVVTESLFSMDGDLLDIHAIGALRKDYSFLTIVDEAHAVGVLGEKGKGIAAGIADIAIGTFGKAFGLFGAFVLLSKEFKEFLFNYAAPLIYTTALPAAHAAASSKILKIVYKSDERRDSLINISKYMKTKLTSAGFNVNGQAQILSVLIGEEEKASLVSTMLLEKGFFCFPARYPTVQKGKAILRISLTALHTKEDVDMFVQIFEKEIKA